MHSFLRAACTGDKQEASRDQPGDGVEEFPAEVPLAELERRASIKFSGATGAVVASGGGEATTAPTYGIVKNVIYVVDCLPPALFARHAAHRPCGLLDKRSAYAMLLCDALGLPLLPWTLAEPIGKDIHKKEKEVMGEKGKARKAASRVGLDPEKAASNVLRRRVELKLPTASDIAKAWRAIEKAAQPSPITKQSPAEQPAADPSNLPNLPEPTPAAAPTPAPESSTPAPAAAPAAPAPAPAGVRRLFGSREASSAIIAVGYVEIYRAQLEEELKTGPRDFDHPDYVNFEAYLRAFLEQSETDYMERLRALESAFPRAISCCEAFLTGKCVHGKSCECGWQQAPWPWVEHVPGGSFCDCHMESRRQWCAGYPCAGMESGVDLWRCTNVSGPFRGDGAS